MAPRTPADHTVTFHFGEKLRKSALGMRVSRDTYGLPTRKPASLPNRKIQSERLWQDTAWAYRDEEHREYSDLYCATWRDRALVNFDLNMIYFRSLDSSEFKNALDQVLTQNAGIREITNLPDYNQVSGVYLMVFDEYKMIYIGQSKDIRKRIKRHWTGKKPFDRLIFGTEFDSIFPVDEFRPLDNTRLYALITERTYDAERNLTGTLDRRFSLNRVDGGEFGLDTLAGHLTNPRKIADPQELRPMTAQKYRDTWDVLKTQVKVMRSNGNEIARELAKIPPHFYEVKRDDGSTFIWTFRSGVRNLVVQGEITLGEYIQYLRRLGEHPILLEG